MQQQSESLQPTLQMQTMAFARAGALANALGLAETLALAEARAAARAAEWARRPRAAREGEWAREARAAEWAEKARWAAQEEARGEQEVTRTRALAWAAARALAERQARALANAEAEVHMVIYDEVLADSKLMDILYSIELEYRRRLACDLWHHPEHWWLIQIIVPITRLPPELLHQILLIIIDNPSDSPLVLMRVSKLWYAIVTGIWAFFNWEQQRQGMQSRGNWKGINGFWM